MKRLMAFFVTSIVLLSSCSSIQKNQMKTVGSITKPEINIKIDINLDKTNIVELGSINEEIEYSQDLSSGFRKQQSKDKTIKIVYIADLLKKDDGIVQLRSQNVTMFDKAISELAGRCLDKYPEMDYILFPKIQLEITGANAFISNALTSYKMRLTGKAVKLELEK